MKTAETMSRKARTREEGYVLLAVLFLVFMVTLALAIAAPKVAADIQRDREIELVHRGKQYVRAVKLYYKKFGAYPPNMEALEKTNEIRFLRKRYKDPVTGKDDWKLIHFGENKTPSLGFFGQPIGGVGGSPLAGVGPGGVGQSLPGSSMTQSNFGGGAVGGSSFGGSSAGGSPFGGINSGGINSGSSNPGGTSGTDPNTGNSGGGIGGSSSTSGSSSGIGTGTGTGTGSSSGSTSAFGNNQTFGGAGIIGVESISPKLGILEWKKKTHFNEWEFWYDPNADRMMISNNAGAAGTPAAGAGNGIGNGTVNNPGAAAPSQFTTSPISGPGSTSPSQPQQ